MSRVLMSAPRVPVLLLVLLLLVLLAGCGGDNGGNSQQGAAPVAPADLLLTNARVYSMAWGDPAPDGTPAEDAPLGPDGWQPDAEAVAVRNGRIVFVGATTAADAYIGRNTDVRDLDGATVLPGLIESHTHVFNLGAKLGRVDLTGVATEEEAVALIKAYAATVPEGDWVVGRGWDEGAWADRYPDKALLSAAVPDHPVFMLSLHSFAGWANQLALDLAGINRDTPTPTGGEIRRDASGNPTGLFLNRAVPLIEAAVPAPSHSELRRQVLLALEQMARDGYVSVHDAGLASAEMAVLEELEAAGELPIRVYAMLSIRDEALARAWLARGPDTDQDSMLVTRSVKAFYDGALGSRGARLLADYSDMPGHRGVSGSTYGFDQALAGDLARAGFQLGIHAIGDAGNRETLDFLEQVIASSPAAAAARHRIEHAQVLHPDDLPRLAELGVIASMEPPHAVEDKAWAEQRLGPQRIKGAYAWRALREAGTHLTFNADNPGSDHNIFYGLHAAVTRRGKDLLPDQGWYPEQALTMDEALRAYTRWSAWAAFQEAHTGQLTVGRWADLTVLDRDPFVAAASDPGSLLAGRVLLTVVAGKPVFDAAADVADPAIPTTADLPINQLQLVGSHNSYKQAMDGAKMLALRATAPAVARSLEYSHPPLRNQLELGLRSLELDIFNDPGAQLFPTRQPNGVASRFPVGHVQFLDFNSSCPTLPACLAEVVAWSDDNPGHLPLVITLNAKTDVIDRPGFPVPLPFDSAAWQALDSEVRAALGDRLLAPAAVLAGGERRWPSLAEARGKVLLVLDEPAAKVAAVAADWAQHAVFATVPPGSPGAAVLVINDPLADAERIRARVQDGFLVRTRADADTEEARSGDTRRRDAAFASGAQVVTTDYYLRDNPFGTGYRVALPGGGAGRCNPVTAPAPCQL